jgi:GT2 family glycosyltransferase
MTPHPAVALIILNWNGWRDTVACVESCRELTWPNYRTVVVDNGSTDGSEENLRRLLPDVEIIQTGANLGFAGGNNIGIRRALEEGADYVWLLNNDTIVAPEALGELVRCLEDNPTAAMAGSKIYYHDSLRTIWCAGGAWEKGRLRLRQRGANQVDDGQFDEPRTMGSVSGCSMLVRSDAIARIGLMDESYFLYWEDTDWCARAREQGYGIVLAAASHVWHKVSATVSAHSERQYYYFTRNGLRFCRRHDLLSLPSLLLYVTADVVVGLLKGNRAKLQGFWRGIADFMGGRMGKREFP